MGVILCQFLLWTCLPQGNFRFGSLDSVSKSHIIVAGEKYGGVNF